MDHGSLIWLHSFKTALSADQASTACASFSFMRNGQAPKQRRASVRAADYGFIMEDFLNIAVAEQGIRGEEKESTYL